MNSSEDPWGIGTFFNTLISSVDALVIPIPTFIPWPEVFASVTPITTVVGAAASIGIGDASPSYMLDVAGAINSQTDVKVNGVSVTEQALNDAVAMAIALG